MIWSVDPSEGSFPGSGYWDGAKWKKLVDSELGTENANFIGAFYPRRHESSVKALAFAVENDPEL